MKIALTSLVIMLTASTPLTIEGVPFERTLQTPNVALKIAGASSFTYALIFDVLSGAIYLPPGTPSSAFPKAHDKALVLSYKRDFSAEEFREVTSNLFRKNNPAADVKSLEASLQAFNELYQDVNEGDRYQLTLIKGTGIELRKNSQPLGVIQDPRFARAVFNVWFGENPFDESFRDNLLKGF